MRNNTVRAACPLACALTVLYDRSYTESESQNVALKEKGMYPLCTLNMLYFSEIPSVFFRDHIGAIGAGADGDQRERGGT